MNLFKKVSDLLYRDISAENETKDLTVLIRLLSLLDAVNCLLLVLLMGREVGLYGAVVSGFFSLVNFLILFMTYRVKSSVTTFLHSFVLCLFTVVFCLMFGNKLGLRFYVFTVIPLIYYRVDTKRWVKAISAVCCGILSGVLGVVAIYTAPPVDITTKTMLYVVLINTAVISVKFILEAYFYYKKFAERETKIFQYSKKLEQLASVDALTQLQNRRGMMTYLDKLSELYPSSNAPFCISICDIDFFKMINDTYGHGAGDYVLQKLAEIFKTFMAGKGNVARWGGEEFLLVFEGLNGDYVFEELDKLKHIIMNSEFLYQENTISITMTFGLEEYDSNLGIKDTITHADNKLYQGKKSGRNCVIY